jgi:hypothetical protein
VSEGFKTGQALRPVKYADGLVPWLRKKQYYRARFIGLRCYRMEINVEETGVMISKELLLVQLQIDQK